MMLGLKLNDRLDDIAREGLLRPKTKEFCASLWFPDFRIFFVAIVINIPSKIDNSNIIFLNVNSIVNKRVRVLIYPAAFN
jgi:hypothetical protein